MKKTAVIIFSRSGVEESRQKALLGNLQKDQTVWDALILKTEKSARQSGLRIITISSDQQKGSSFAERFTNAFKYAFSLGYDQIISVGNDCLELSTNDIRRAKKELDLGNCVLGPAWDGGVYLIGLRKEDFHEESFLKISWQTSLVLQELRMFAKTKIVELEFKNDLDTFGPLCKRKLRALLPSQASKLVEHILSSLFRGKGPISIPILQSVKNSPRSLRAPPVTTDPVY